MSLEAFERLVTSVGGRAIMLYLLPEGAIDFTPPAD